MNPPLRERLGWRNPTRNGIELPATRAAMARAAALLAVAGALLGAVAVALPSGEGVDEGALLAVSGAAAAMAVLLATAHDRIPIWGFHAAVVAGSALASVAVHAAGPDSALGPLPYSWIVLYAFYFFPVGPALAHVAAVAAGYAVVLAYRDGDAGLGGWAATVLLLSVGGLLVALGRDRLGRLISRLADAAHRDALTGLLNRRGFEHAFDVELERARRTDAPLSLVVGDLDRFKRINDEHGHAAGDEALRRIARTIASTKRTFDSAARVGGEELALLAPGSDEHGAYMLAERIRADVEDRSGPEAELTISLGVATFPIHGQSAESLLLAADQALYAAKRLGRNRTVISSAEVPGILARAPLGGEEGQVELGALLGLAEALDVRESGSASHCHRVGRFAEVTARELGLSPDSVERVRLAGILHDVGRVGMPDAVLGRPGPLSERERSLVRLHPEIGARLVETTDFADIRSWILLHHERPDGTGYPEGRRAREVPLEARILAVADAYEAMTSERPYRGALHLEEAAAELRRGAGRQFDAEVVEALLRAM